MMQLVSTSSFHCLWYEWVVSTDVEHFSYHRSICDLSLFRNGCFIASECSTQGASVTKTWSTNGGIPRLRREWSDKTVGAGKLSLDSPPEFRHCLWTMPFHQKQCTKKIVGVIPLPFTPQANLVSSIHVLSTVFMALSWLTIVSYMLNMQNWRRSLVLWYGGSVCNVPSVDWQCLYFPLCD